VLVLISAEYPPVPSSEPKCCLLTLLKLFHAPLNVLRFRPESAAFICSSPFVSAAWVRLCASAMPDFHSYVSFLLRWRLETHLSISQQLQSYAYQ